MGAGFTPPLTEAALGVQRVSTDAMEFGNRGGPLVGDAE